MKITFVYCVFENLGVEWLSAYLKRHGYQTELVFDPRLFDFASKLYSFRPLGKLFNIRKKLLRRILISNPDLLCFSVVSADYQWALDFAQDIKRVTNVPIVFGGIHPTAVPEHVLANEEVDYVIVGEGEGALLDLVRGLEKGDVDPSTPNLWLRVDGKIIGNKPRPLIENLDDLPFPDKEMFYHLGPPFDIGHMAMARRGCHGSCSYCCNSLRRKIYFADEYGNRYRTAPGFLRRRSVGHMLAEIKWAREKFGIRLIRFNDDDFAESEEWLEEYRDKAKGDLKIPYKCFVNASSINERTAKLLEESGCKQVQMGVQSLNPKISAFIHRIPNNRDIERAIECFEKTSITLLTDNMFGIPGEEEDDYLNLIRFYLEHPVDFLNVYWLIYFPRTEMVEQAEQLGVLDKNKIRNMELNPYGGDINRRTRLHSANLLRMKNLCEIYNYFPRPVIRFIMEHKLYKLLPPLNLFFPLRVMGVLRHVKNGDFPAPTTGYELVWLRHRRLLKHWIPKVLFG